MILCDIFLSSVIKNIYNNYFIYIEVFHGSNITKGRLSINLSSFTKYYYLSGSNISYSKRPMDVHLVIWTDMEINY